MNSGVVLVVDDDLSIRSALTATLQPFGFKVVAAGRSEEALSLVRTNPFDAVLLDINMPGINGVDLCRKMRRLLPRLPILMLTVRDTENDKVEALDAGANDFITKPFRLRELVARIRAAVRWTRLPPEPNEPPSPLLRVGDFELDLVHRTMKKGDRAVHLTPKEFELTHQLMTHSGKPIPHARLMSYVWGPEHAELEHLRTMVRQIRKKIEDDPANPRYLLTDAHIGYRFVDEQFVG